MSVIEEHLSLGKVEAVPKIVRQIVWMASALYSYREQSWAIKRTWL